MERDEPASCGGPRSRARRQKETKIFPPKGGGNITATAKAYKSPITEIVKYTFNTGENKFAAQFTESQERVAGYVQRSGMEESYLVAKTIRTGTAQKIPMPPAVNPNAPDKANLELIWVKVVKSVAKR